MGNTRIEISVGAFMLLGLAALLYLAVRLGDLELLASDRYVLDAHFVSSSGLKPGAFVEVGGVRDGAFQHFKIALRTLNPAVSFMIRFVS